MEPVVEARPEGGTEQFGSDIWQQLCSFEELLISEGQLRGLVGPREMDKLWTRHILNSLAVVPFLDEGATLADVGSGAGFPGIIVAIARPDVSVTLIETMQRRTDWLSFVKSELGLENVTVLRARAENVKPAQFDYVTARAVAALPKLLPWTAPLAKSNGSVLALKGGRAEQEIDDSVDLFYKYDVDWVEIHEVTPWGTSESTRVVEIKKL